ncbi:MAG TPA: amidohydrolase [Rhodocyclaceae bacterium]|nr:amidohydrolase [Rhodocyclaceae bacterium]
MNSIPVFRPAVLALALAAVSPAAPAQTAVKPAPAAAATAAPVAARPAAPSAPAATPAAATTKPAVPPTPTPPAPAGTAAAAGVPVADPNAPQTPPPPPLSDVIFTNGDVITLDDKRPTAQAVAIKGSKILAVGKTKDILARWKSEGTEVVDLAGKTLAPGFIDAWGGLSRLGLNSVAAQIQPPPAGTAMDVAAIQRTLRDWAKGDIARRFGWIVGFGYDDSLLHEQRPLSRADLDAVARDTPVLIIHASGRQVVLNSRALELAGITRDSTAPAGGAIGRWPGTKEPDGVLDGAAAVALLGQLPQLPPDERQALIQQGQTLYLRNGYTTAVEARATPEDLALYTQAADTGALKLDVAIYADLAASGAVLKGHKSVGPRYYKNRLRLAGVSMALDGSAEDRSAWLTDAYRLPPPGKRAGFAGYGFATDEDVTALATRATANGWALAVQANGDAAIDQFLRALRAATPAPGKGLRPLLAGAQTLRDDQLDALQVLGVGVSLAPQRLALSRPVLVDDTLGTERTAHFAPAAGVLARGLPLTLHTDPALIEPAPLAVMAAALKRPVGADQQIAAVDAFKALTLTAARQIGEDKTKGSVVAGKLADLVVLSANPLKTPPERLGDIQVIGTVKEGVTVFGGADGGVPITR